MTHTIEEQMTPTRRRGQSLVEYALILALIAATLLLTLRLLGVSVADVFAAMVAALGGDACEVYTDTGFDGGLDDWTPVEYGFWRGDMGTSDGQLAAAPLSAMLLDGFSGEDYTIDVGEVRLQQVRNVYQGYGVMFRSSQDRRGRMNGYMVEIEKVNRRDSGTLYFSKWVNGNQVRPPIAAQRLSSDFDWENPPRLKVGVEGDTFTAFLDGKEVLQGRDSLYTEGTVGVAANFGSKMQMDELSVSDPTCKE